jgi:single-stranded DNA-binding protein
MADLNSLNLIGVIKGNIETIPEGCKFQLEHDRAFSKESKLILIPCAAFKKTADTIIKYCKDNSKIGIEGSLEYNPSGDLYVKVNQIHFLGKGFKKEDKSYSSDNGGW